MSIALKAEHQDLAESGFSRYCQSFSQGIRPDPPLWVDEWADKHMVIPASLGSAEPGRYRLSRTPFARDVMRALSPEHPARRVVVKGASQLLKTQVGLNWICALIAGAPANMIMLQPTDKLAKRVASRFDKTVAAVPQMQGRVADKRSRDSRNTADTKEFRGGTLWILTGRSASNLSEASARYVYADEVDRILRELKGEGDPIALLEKRQATYGRKGKGYYTSSPTEEGSSRIEELYRSGNQHQLQVPCPHCGSMQALEWENAFADIEKGIAWMVCIENGCIIEESSKPWMLARHEWVAQAKGDGQTWSYEINYLYAPLGWDSWLRLHQEHAEALSAQEKGDTEKMQVFVNTRLARVWSQKKSRVEPQALKDKAEDYPRGIAPDGALMVTAAADVQGNRIELQIAGWGPGPGGLEKWIIDTHIFYGDPTLHAVWDELDQVLCTPIKHASGSTLYIRAAAIDSGDGDSTDEVYAFVKKRKHRYVSGQLQKLIAVKGSSQSKKPIIAGKPSKTEVNQRGKPVPGSAEVWMVGTDTAKDWILNRLALPNQVVIHTSKDFPIEFYEQLLSETKVTKWKSGRKFKVYEPIKKGIRNEQLDMAVYNLACAHHLGIPTYTEKRWEKMREELLQQQIDLMSELMLSPAPSTPIAPVIPSASPPETAKKTISEGFGSSDWNL